MNAASDCHHPVMALHPSPCVLATDVDKCGAQFLQGQAKDVRVLEADSQLLAVAIFSPLELTACGSLTWGKPW